MRCAIVASLVVLTCWAGAQQLDLLRDAERWTAGTGSGAAMISVSAGGEAPLAATVTSDGGKEDRPALRLAFATPQDWTRFSCLRVRARVTCDDPLIGSKRLSIVLSDGVGEAANLQTLRHTVAVGRWTEYRDWLVDTPQQEAVARGAICQVALQLNEDCKQPQEYRWEIARLCLEGVGARPAVLDTETYDARELVAEEGLATASVSSGDGLKLSLTESGGIGSVEVDGRPVGAHSGQLTGLLVRDVGAPGAPVRCGGAITQAEGVVRQWAQADALGLAVDAAYTPLADRIEVIGRVRDLRGEDRAITLYLALPLDGEAWTWWDSVSQPRDGAAAEGELSLLERGMQFGLHGAHSKYPIGTVSSEDRAGLSLGIRMDEPVIHRIGYSPSQHLLYIALDFGLVPQSTVDGRSLAEAPFRILLYRSDPAWGMRAALQRYYAFFPALFTKHTVRDGGWYGSGDMRQTDGALEAGFGFHWGPSETALQWDHDNGINGVLYLEPEFHQQTHGDYDRAPTAEEARSRLGKLAAGDEQELAAFEKLAYARTYLPESWVARHSLREAATKASQVTQTVVAYGPHGVPEIGIAQFPWIGDSRWSAMFAWNMDPGIPDGAWGFWRDEYIGSSLQRADELGTHYDGLGIDSLGGYGQFCRANFRRDHFRYCDFPLCFSDDDLRPVQPVFMGTVEWLRKLAEEMHGRGMILMANCAWSPTPGWLTFAAPYLDVFGAEAPAFSDPDFIRAIAFRKACTDLPYSPRPEWELARHMLHGIFPGQGSDIEGMKRHAAAMRALSAAGWEPVTHARVDAESVQLERFGTGKTVYIVAHNRSDGAVSAKVAVDLKALGLEECRATDVVDGKAVGLSGGTMGLELAERGTVAVVVEGR